MEDTRPLGLRWYECGYHDLESYVKPFYVAQYKDKPDLIQAHAPNLFQHVVHSKRHIWV